jgi:hypothetical protein
MKLTLILTPEALGANRLHAAFDDKRDALGKLGVTVGTALGRKNHTRLFMAVTDPAHVDPLRASRGYVTAPSQVLLAEAVAQALVAEAGKAGDGHLVLMCAQLVPGLTTGTELIRLRDLLARLSDDIRLVLHIEDQARVLVRFHAEQVWGGRSQSLHQEIALAAAPDWTAAALAGWTAPDLRLNRFPEIDAAPFWLDWAALKRRWEDVFGADRMMLRPHDPAVFGDETLTREIEAMLGLSDRIGKVAPASPAAAPSAEWLTRARQMNALFGKVLESGRIIPRLLWRRMLGELAMPGEPIAPGSLARISARFADGNAALASGDAGLAKALAPDPALPDWSEVEPTNGFRATQYLAVFLPRIDKATAEARKEAEKRAAGRKSAPKAAALSATAEKLLPPLAKATFAELSGGRFAPHNRLGRVNEEELAAAYSEAPPRKLPNGSTGNVIVGCMKNEGPYILEWVAYHRAIGVDNFLIYTNGCEDGTDAILDRMQDMGILQHRLNDEWKGKSPQQAALNKSLKEPLVKKADWLIHIDVDEFMNIRTGNGTLDDLFAKMPEATNIAMTWRLFGHSGVTRIVDEPVIGQFQTCAPAWCPKPHTVWGFKTMFRNNGAYAKMSCHRPNKLAPAKRTEVKWFNGSGQPMAESLKDKGWRSGTGDIGYDLIQLNHYALRSAESFLIKRQRGRALHVDRSIGLSYWIRMDWSDAVDVTIQRNLPRLKAEMARLMADDRLAALHRASLDWHRAKAAELHGTPEFRDLYQQALETKLSGMERVAYALALDLES